MSVWCSMPWSCLDVCQCQFCCWLQSDSCDIIHWSWELLHIQPNNHIKGSVLEAAKKLLHIEAFLFAEICSKRLVRSIEKCAEGSMLLETSVPIWEGKKSKPPLMTVVEKRHWLVLKCHPVHSNNMHNSHLKDFHFRLKPASWSCFLESS